jgi:hypothetical protein
MKQQIAGFAGKQLRGSRQGPIGKAEPLKNHAGDGFARCELRLWIGPEASVDHVNEAQVFDDRREHASGVEAFNVNLFHW